MRKLLFVLILSLPSFVSADIIKCSFTEPFLNTTYSMAQMTLTVDRAEGGTQVFRNVSFQILGPGRFELWSRNRRVLQRLNLNMEGTDGMSDRVYPYSARYAYGEYGMLTGGCTSNFMKARD
jgi:uncharacterized membrane protein